jgi:zinc protease
MNSRVFLAAASAAILASAVSADALAQGRAPALRVPYTIDTLPNGLRLIVHEDHSVPIAQVNVWFHVGSGDEPVGRTGFAHLFEHLMFMGTTNVPYGQFDGLLEGAGGFSNATVDEDRSMYYQDGPANAVPLMLWMESDRLLGLVDAMDTTKVNQQREIVKNERRQRMENTPYGIAFDHLPNLIYPNGHPYSWPVIGSMADLSAASLDDVKTFFRTYYAPNNATIVVAGAVRADSVRALARQMFADVPRGGTMPERPVAPAFTLRDTVHVLEDRVQLPRLYLAWKGVKYYSSDDAALDVAAYILTGARNSRLTQALVFQSELATGASAFNGAKRLDGDFMFMSTARPGVALDTIQAVVDAELRRLASQPPTARELEQAKNAIEASFLNSLEFVSAKAGQLNSYLYATGEADYFQRDLDRYRAVTAADVQRVVRQYLLAPRVTLSVVPRGRPELAATKRIVP